MFIFEPNFQRDEDVSYDQGFHFRLSKQIRYSFIRFSIYDDDKKISLISDDERKMEDVFLRIYFVKI